MTALNKQALRQLATDAHELGIIKRYTKGIEANKRFAAIATPLTVLALLDAMEAAEKRIAELEVFISQSCYVFDGRDADISDSYIDASTSSLMPKVSTKNEGDPCRYCSDGSYSGLPGGACEHCMGTGLDNPAAGIGVKGE